MEGVKLSQVVAAYVTHRQAMGMRFHTEARTLRSFCRASGDVTMQEITAEQLLAFLAGTGPVTSYWERKHSALSGLYRFAVARGYVDHSPLSSPCLVAEGLSLKEVGDHLGHRSAYATRTYARVDLAELREVAAFDLGGLS